MAYGTEIVLGIRGGDKINKFLTTLGQPTITRRQHAHHHWF